MRILNTKDQCKMKNILRISHDLSYTACVAVTVLLFAQVAVAQISALEGDVKGIDGAPVSGAVIKIDRIDVSGRYKCTTNKKGHYFYNGLPLGTYRVTCNVNGKDVEAIEARTQLGDPISVNFDLRTTTREQEQPPRSPDRSTGLGSIYVNAENAADRLRLNADGSFSLQEGGQAFTGSYTVAGSTLKLRIAQLQKDVDILVQGNELVVNGQEIWTQPNAVGGGIANGSGIVSKTTEVNPSEAAKHNNLALAFGKAKNFPGMEAETLKAAQLDPSKAGQYYYNMGAMLVIAGQSEQAAAAFRKAIEADPKHADSYYQLGVYLIGKASFAADGRVTPAPGTVEAFQKYVELAPMGQFAESAKGMLKSLNAK